MDRLKLKADSAAKVAAARPSPTLTTLAFLIFTAIVSAVQTNLSERFDVWFDEIKNFFWGMLPFPALVLTNMLLVSGLFIILLRIILRIATTGYNWYALRISRSLNATFSNLLDPINSLFKVIGLSIVISVLCFLWSLLLIVPGIIAFYRYRQAYFILYDHPEYGVLDCIRESKRIMRGYKAELFVLDLSFIGWHILCLITVGILYIWKLPYIEVTYANFYNELRGQMEYTFR